MLRNSELDYLVSALIFIFLNGIEVALSMAIPGTGQDT